MTDELCRLSIINYLNAEPLNYGFKRGLNYQNFYLKFQGPAASCDSLKLGEVDAGLISSIEYQRIPDLKIISNLCIGSQDSARSVLIFSKVPFDEIKSLALDTSSRTSVVLGQILLKEKFGCSDLKTTYLMPDLRVMLRDHDAALMIGDQAMRSNSDGLLVLDLSHEWKLHTNLPFVFAFWGVHPRAPKALNGRPLQWFFEESFRQGNENLSTIIEEAKIPLRWSETQLRAYFTENISYHLGPKEKASLALFYEKAFSHGFVPKVRELSFM